MRNKLAGTKRGKSKSARYYQNNPIARAVKKVYDTIYHKQGGAIKYRTLLNKKKKAGKGKDNAHVGKGEKTRKMSMSKNRANNRPKYKKTRAPKIRNPKAGKQTKMKAFLRKKKRK